MFRHKMELTLKICTMPFTEYEFYKKDYLEELLNKTDIEEYKDYLKYNLLKNIYTMINRSQRINNLDEVNLLFNKFYTRNDLLSSGNINRFYMNFLSKMCKSLITHRNGRVALKYWESDGEEDFIGPYKGINKVALWNSLNRMFTTDLLVIRYLLDNDMKDEIFLSGYYSSIMLEDLQLEKILNKGLAETHIHKGAAINFYISWQQLMSFRKKLASYKDDLFYDNIIGKNIGLKNYIGAMAIVRLLIADFLIHYNGNNYTLNEYLEDNYKDARQEYLEFKDTNIENLNKKAKNRYEYLKSRYEGKKTNKTSNQDNEIYKIFQNIFNGDIIEDNQYRFSQLWDRCKEKVCRGVDNNINRNGIGEDILNKIFDDDDRDIKTTMENIFLFKCMIYLDNNEEDEFFTKIFWQYIRIKNEVFQLKVQSNSIRGLDNFSNYFKRSTDIDTDNSKEYWKLIMLNQFQNGHLKKLELRSGFGKGNSVEEFKLNIKNTLRDFLKAYKEILNQYYDEDEEVPSVGLIFHMRKDLDKNEPEKCWQNYCGIEKNELYFTEIQKRYKRQVEALNYVRERFPKVSEYILGIDAASIENNTEPWVFAPVYEEARNSTNNKLIYNINTNKSVTNRIKSLGFTFHVGEDFRHLMTGIRRIDEVIEHFKFHSGDRIGHGMALGLDVDTWINNNKIIILPRGEYLDNLLWIWGIYKDKSNIKTFDISYLEQEIMKICEKIYCKIEGITVYSLWKAYRKKFKTFSVDENYKNSDFQINIGEVLFCKHANKNEVIMWNEEKLLHANHCQVYLEKMLEPIQVEIKIKDVEMLKEAQRIVTAKVSNQGIIIETNPTSNVAIGEIESIFEHYSYNLNQRGLNVEDNLNKSVIISINSDDPSVFNTNVSNEFAYIFYSLQEKGHSREDILMWIDKIRRYGMEYSFIDDRGLSRKQRIDEVENILKDLEVNIKG